MKDMNMESKTKAMEKAKIDSSEGEDVDEDDNDPDNYPDVEKEGDEESLKRRYQNALREQGIQVDESDRSFAEFVARSQRGG